VSLVTEDGDGSAAGTATSRALGLAMQREYESGVASGSATSGFTATQIWYELTVTPVTGGTDSLTSLTFGTSYFSGLTNRVTIVPEPSAVLLGGLGFSLSRAAAAAPNGPSQKLMMGPLP
jgi:hypothetical protein